MLSERGHAALLHLIANDAGFGANKHVYCVWPEAGVDDEKKILLTEQLANLDASYPGGLASYIAKARKLLKESSEGLNPFEEYTASIPTGEILRYGHLEKKSDECMSFRCLFLRILCSSGQADRTHPDIDHRFCST